MMEKDVNFSKFLILRVETANWPTWMGLCRNVRMSVPYIFDRDAQNKQKR